MIYSPGTKREVGDGVALLSGSGTLRDSIDGVTASGNLYGVEGFGATTVALGRSTLVNNSNYGVNNGTSPNTFYTYNDNHMDLNGVGGRTGAALQPLPAN